VEFERVFRKPSIPLRRKLRMKVPNYSVSSWWGVVAGSLFEPWERQKTNPVAFYSESPNS